MRLAYAVSGEGPPLVMTAKWLTHLEHQWRSLAWRPWLEAFVHDHKLLRYDARGCGLSDRDAPDRSFDNWGGHALQQATGFPRRVRRAAVGRCTVKVVGDAQVSSQFADHDKAPAMRFTLERPQSRSMGSLMRVVLIVLLLSGCATASVPQGFYGTWHGPRTISFQGSEYEMNGTTGHYASDARTLYFTEHSGTRISRQPVTLACPYALMGDTHILRDCPYAGEYTR